MIFASCLLLLSNHVYAELSEWLHQALKVDNPNQLAYWVEVGKNCPVTQKEVENLVEGVFIRSRIKPLKEGVFDSGVIYLDVGLVCNGVSSNHIDSYVSKILFGRIVPTPAVWFQGEFGTVGRGSKDFMVGAVKGSVEAAITEYIKANFDL